MTFIIVGDKSYFRFWCFQTFTIRWYQMDYQELNRYQTSQISNANNIYNLTIYGTYQVIVSCYFNVHNRNYASLCIIIIINSIVFWTLELDLFSIPYSEFYSYTFLSRYAARTLTDFDILTSPNLVYRNDFLFCLDYNMVFIHKLTLYYVRKSQISFMQISRSGFRIPSRKVVTRNELWLSKE